MQGNTFLGGSAEDRAKDVILDQQDNLVITGDTHSIDFPMTMQDTLPPNISEVFVSYLLDPWQEKRDTSSFSIFFYLVFFSLGIAGIVILLRKRQNPISEQKIVRNQRSFN